MNSAPNPLDHDRIVAGLPVRGAIVGREIQIFAQTDSTNDLARRAGEGGAAEGLVFFAESQRVGRGRRGNPWVSRPASSLLLSVLLRPVAPREKWPRLTLIAVRALLEAIDHVGDVTAQWKWPNDVVVGPRKLAGILVEATPEFVVLGIGLNVRQRAEDFPDEIRDRAASVEMLAARPIDRETLAAAILSAMDRDYQGDWTGAGFGAVRDFCIRRSALAIGAVVTVAASKEQGGGKMEEGTIRGAVVGYSADGFLRIETKTGEIVEVSGGLVENG